MMDFKETSDAEWNLLWLTVSGNSNANILPKVQYLMNSLI